MFLPIVRWQEITDIIFIFTWRSVRDGNARDGPASAGLANVSLCRAGATGGMVPARRRPVLGVGGCSGRTSSNVMVWPLATPGSSLSRPGVAVGARALTSWRSAWQGPRWWTLIPSPYLRRRWKTWWVNPASLIPNYH
jgi:hypothetical protein